MRVRPHRSQQEVAEELPLLTETAVVTDVTAMDDNRTGEALAAIRETLEAAGTDAYHRARPNGEDACESWLADRLDAADHRTRDTPLSEYLPADERDGPIGERLAALQARYLQPYPSLLRITVDADEPVEFAAGQYLAIRYADTPRVYSVASSPTRDALEFCVRRVPGGELTSDLAVDLEAGDEVTLRGPYGELVLEEPSSRDLVFLATGTGVAPLKSMIDYTLETGRDRFDDESRAVWLFLGAGWRDQLPYHDAFRRLADDRPNFHYVPTLSREPYLTDWPGETAYVQYVLTKYLDEAAVDTATLPDAFARYLDEPTRDAIETRLRPGEMEVYACGLNAMVASLVDAVETLGVPPEYTQFEGFG